MNKTAYLKNTHTAYETISPKYGLEYNKALWNDHTKAYILKCNIIDIDMFLIFQLTYPEYIVRIE